MTLFTRAAKDAQRQIAVETASLDPDLALCYQLYLTPTAQILEGPYPDKSNRVLRLYPGFHHHFLRVTFTDEGGESRRIRKPWGANFDHNQFVQVHVGGFLKQGFSFAGREWKWLAYSQSALKESQMLYMCSFNSPDGTFVTPQMIRNQLGIFDKVINQPAKYGARMAQAFSATNASIQIESKYVERIPDIECGSYCFTDGAGELSEDMAADIWHALTKRRGRTAPPSAFQARYGGCKGVWTVNHELAGKVLRIRPSQEKFASSSITFDVAATSKRPGVTYLNRPLIKLLEDLGVAPQTFLDIQRKAVQGLEVALTGYSLAGNMLGENNLASSFRGAALFTNLYEMLDIDFNSSPKDNIDFFKRAAMVGITHCLRDIKFRARILVEGPTLIGVCDVWNILKEGEIYVNQDNFKRKGRTALQGKVLVTRSPVIHPGDVQFAQAIGPVDPASPLFHLVNVVVFSARGSRPLPSMLGGGDLDGDLFNVITNEDLFPTKIMEAGSYDAVDPDKLTRPSEMDDVADFVVYDAVGQISTRHLTIADQSPEGSLDPRCYQLAQFASDAVDFVKSGVPVNTEKLPKADSKSFKPDFLAAAHDQQYPSKKVLGQMFRSVPASLVPMDRFTTAEDFNRSRNTSYRDRATETSKQHAF
ncbi:RNA-dependent RNA polymerase [Mycena floridula]|nr:RNA-dependent RNA polymerase [Mycena floridula]